jgi:AraC-like DNA-binding protein
MRRAVLELVTTHEYVSQIAYAVGYSDHGNFDHDFKAFFGISPRAFRRLL